jgi:deoxyinosine 3'endonuclease (endonuclease V)
MAPECASKSVRAAWVAEQERLSKLCVDADQLDFSAYGQFIHGLRYVAGVDVSFFPDGTHAVAAVVVVSYPDMEVVYEHCSKFKLKVPYMPGFLAFREVPALKAMIEKVPRKLRPQVVLVDGNGVFHPRKCGSATHLGIVTGLPTIGVAKEVMQVGDINERTAREIAKKLDKASAWAPLIGKDEDETLASLLRPNFGKKILVVSAGHKISLGTATVLTASLCKTSIPEPIRQADLRSRAAVRAWFWGMAVAKLKLPSDAGNLLPFMMPEPERHENATSDSRGHELTSMHYGSGRPHSFQTPGQAHPSQANMRNRSGLPTKTKMVWRVKHASHGDLSAQSVQKTSTIEENNQAWRFWIIIRETLFGCCIARDHED